ncbi:MAG: heavy metal-binding domain-containing protein [Chitinophagaceae bacterium]
MKKIFIIAVMFATSLATYAQKAKASMVQNKPTAVATANYSCPMHPDCTSSKPGKCSKCGMDLNLSAKEKMKMEVMKKYTCTMHPEVGSTKKEKCTKCGMDLTEVKTKMNKG